MHWRGWRITLTSKSQTGADLPGADREQDVSGVPRTLVDLIECGKGLRRKLRSAHGWETGLKCEPIREAEL